MEFQDEDRFFDISVMIRSGIYVLLWRGEVVYVGQSEKMHARIATHCVGKAKRVMKLGGRTIRGVVFDAIWAMPVLPSDLSRVEKEYIEKYQPKYNVHHTGLPKISIEELVAIMARSDEPKTYIRRRL